MACFNTVVGQMTKISQPKKKPRHAIDGHVCGLHDRKGLNVVL